jgi:tetratricopeptide (TPR) repeat protein
MLILVVAGVWFFLSSDNPRVGKPQGVLGTPQTGTQAPAVETPAPTSKSTIGSGTDAAGIRMAVETAKRRGDNYYYNGEYDKAVDTYHEGLKLDPSNAQILKALQRAETAKAAEQKFNQ